MKTLRIDNMVRGWFVGAFEPTAYHTNEFEVGYQTHRKGAIDHHFHPIVTEINLVVSGSMILHGKQLGPGDIFILEPYEITNPEFLEDTSIVCVKVPSINDKIRLEIKDR